MKRETTSRLTAASLWRNLRDPVLALAEELALRRGAAGQVAVMFKLHAGGAEAWRSGSQSPGPALSAPGRPAEAATALVQRMGGRISGDAGIEFPADQAVTRQIMLPAEPETVLRAITRNKVEGLAPWPLAQCLWGMRIRPATGETRQVAVDVAVISRAAFDEIAAVLRQAGAAVRVLSVRLADGGTVAIDFDGGDERRKARAGAGRLAKLAAAALLAAAAFGGYEIYRSYAALWRLEAETASAAAALRTPAGGVAETPLAAAANNLRQLRLQRPPVVALLDDLSALLPNTVYLEALALNDGKLELKGQGSDIPALIAILESSPLLRDVNFAAATERGQESGANAFTLNARFEPDADGAAP